MARPSRHPTAPPLWWKLLARLFTRLPCPRCTHLVVRDWRVCARCGFPLVAGAPEPQECRKCGTALASGARYCPACTVRVQVARQRVTTARVVTRARRSAGVPAPKRKPVVVAAPAPAAKPAQPVRVTAHERQGRAVDAYVRASPATTAPAGQEDKPWWT